MYDRAGCQTFTSLIGTAVGPTDNYKCGGWVLCQGDESSLLHLPNGVYTALQGLNQAHNRPRYCENCVSDSKTVIKNTHISYFVIFVF